MLRIHGAAPAKLNLFLHIINRRSDGYHELQTAFQLLNYYDELTFIRRSDSNLNLHCQSIDALVDLAIHPGIHLHENLVFKAASFLHENYQPRWGVDIQLKKRIPIGGGLGGGSSNAATTLLALNQLWDLRLSQDELSTIALRLGTDVPLFIHGKTAWGEGLGERLTPLPHVDNWFVVIVPPVSVSTREVFSLPQLTRQTPVITIPVFLNENTETRNDCEIAVRQTYPIVAEALDRLNKFQPARLTGSGACIFARVADRKQGLAILQQMPSHLPGFVAQGINQSPQLRVDRGTQWVEDFEQKSLSSM